MKKEGARCDVKATTKHDDRVVGRNKHNDRATQSVSNQCDLESSKNADNKARATRQQTRVACEQGLQTRCKQPIVNKVQK